MRTSRTLTNFDEQPRAADVSELDGGPGFNQVYPLSSELLEQVEHAIVADRKELGRVASRSDQS